jgi:MFS family permease
MAGTPQQGAATDASGRPTARLPVSHLLRISAYWLGLTAIDSAVGLVVSNRLQYDGLVDPTLVGRTGAMIGIGVAAVGLLVQPTVGAISDYTVSRWGRRKPWIVIGSLLDVVFLLGIAYANTLIAIAAFAMLLAFSTNLARGPFQGYVPDLVPSPQVGVASGLVGLMQILGNVTGFALASFAARMTAADRDAAALTGREPANYLPLALVAVAVVELVTMVSVVLRVGKGRDPLPRHGRSWLAIARSAWAADILRERSYVWLVVSRLFFLMAGSILVNLMLAYLNFTHGLEQGPANDTYLIVLAVVLVANLIAIIPAARLSDRIGRKPVIYLSIAMGAAGVVFVGLSPNLTVAMIGAAAFGASAGMFLSVDWALMTDIIPKASAGRYMGLSNLATGAATPLGQALGGTVMDLVNVAAKSLHLGPRVAFLVGATLYILAGLTLRPVREPGRQPPGAAADPGA